MSRYAVVVLGGSAAGLSAALVLSRARRRVLVVDAGTPRNAPAAHRHARLSCDDMPPENLLAVGHHEHRTQLTARALEVVEGTVHRILIKEDRACGIEMDDGRTADGLRCSCPRASFRTTPSWSASAAIRTRTAGCPPSLRAQPACPVCGPPKRGQPEGSSDYRSWGGVRRRHRAQRRPGRRGHPGGASRRHPR